jgi:hypothetical protein
MNDHTLEVPKFEGNILNVQGVATKDESVVVLHPLVRMSKSAALIHAAHIVALADHSENFEEFRAILKAVLQT